MALPDRAPAEAVAPGGGQGIAALHPVPPVVLVIAGATSIQFGAALAATLFDEAGPAGTSLLRLGFAAVILVAVWRPRPRAYDMRALRLVAAFGLSLGLMNFCFYEGLARVPLGVAVTIEFIGPVGLAVALSRRRLDLLWIALAVGGILLLADPFGSGGPDPLGVLFVLLAGGFWAAYIVFAQRAAHVFRASTGLAMASVVAALVPLGPGLVEAGGDLLAPGILATGAAVAVLSSVIPYSLETEALRRLPAHVFGVLMSLEPAVAALAGLVVLGQRLNATDLLAIGLVIVASIGVTRTHATAPFDG